MPMPAIVTALSKDSYEKEQEEKEKKEPKFQNVKWGTASAEEGEEVELTASVQDITDGNMVTLQVFREGYGPENGVPYATFPLTVNGGSVSAKWKYMSNQNEMPPESDPKFVFTAHCAWCNFEKSSNTLEVKLKRPEITKAEWKNADGDSVSTGLVGEELTLSCETKDVEDGEGVTFRVFDEHKREVFSEGAVIESGKAEVKWTYHYNGEEFKEKPKYKFEVTGTRIKKVESSECEINGKIEFTIINSQCKLLSGLKYSIFINDKKQDNGDFNAELVTKDNVIPGQTEILIKFNNKTTIEEKNEFEIENNHKVSQLDFFEIGFKKLILSLEKLNVIQIINDTMNLSE